MTTATSSAEVHISVTSLHIDHGGGAMNHCLYSVGDGEVPCAKWYFFRPQDTAALSAFVEQHGGNLARGGFSLHPDHLQELEDMGVPHVVVHQRRGDSLSLHDCLLRAEALPHLTRCIEGGLRELFVEEDED